MGSGNSVSHRDPAQHVAYRCAAESNVEMCAERLARATSFAGLQTLRADNAVANAVAAMAAQKVAKSSYDAACMHRDDTW